MMVYVTNELGARFLYLSLFKQLFETFEGCLTLFSLKPNCNCLRYVLRKEPQPIIFPEQLLWLFNCFLEFLPLIMYLTSHTLRQANTHTFEVGDECNVNMDFSSSKEFRPVIISIDSRTHIRIHTYTLNWSFVDVPLQLDTYKQDI